MSAAPVLVPGAGAAMAPPARPARLVVQKYGGSSVADVERLRHVARRVVGTASTGAGVVVVVSAMGKTTDMLLRTAAELTATPAAREVDLLLATGEQMACALLAMAIGALAQPARAFTGGQSGIRTDGHHGGARVEAATPGRIREALGRGEVAVVAGFQGVTSDDEITTLGRGGSDLTAVVLAAALDADVCEIYTDVDGVYTADPRLVPDCQRASRLSYDDMLELASLGAKVLQARAVEFAKRHRVRVRVRSTFTPDAGTLIAEECQAMDDLLFAGVTCDRGHARVSLCGIASRPDLAARIFGALAEERIAVDMVTHMVSVEGAGDVSFTLPHRDRARAEDVLAGLVGGADGIGLAFDDRVAKVSVVGSGLRSYPGTTARVLEVLARTAVDIKMIATSELAISCVVDDAQGETAVRALHTEFGVLSTRDVVFGR
jgi:aspartate kinase